MKNNERQRTRGKGTIAAGGNLKDAAGVEETAIVEAGTAEAAGETKKGDRKGETAKWKKGQEGQKKWKQDIIPLMGPPCNIQIITYWAIAVETVPLSSRLIEKEMKEGGKDEEQERKVEAVVIQEEMKEGGKDEED
ncbi:hypothetical protein Pcinc_010483 [Petrolisthes cinctipes]|uniref:Uncharacterized protein n=1 Tax=Petrolisthes cinctipes TaxID=88211 RepID=A0AAE1G4U5_PETCI|nr:hypothetical protein Pcinc_010483 [Petrolisthes cinctipes]